jgi:hypothetical protein
VQRMLYFWKTCHRGTGEARANGGTVRYFHDDLGPVWFVSSAYPTKKLVMPNIPLFVWFVANYLAAYGSLVVSFIDSSQNFGRLWVADSRAKILASQFWYGCRRRNPNTPLALYGYITMVSLHVVLLYSRQFVSSTRTLRASRILSMFYGPVNLYHILL